MNEVSVRPREGATELGMGAAKGVDVGDIGFQRQLREVYSKTVLRKGEDRVLVRRIRAGGPGAEAAKQRLFDGVQQYVVRTARAFVGRGVELPDLIQEGNLGVLRAIETYDLDRNLAFLTYADDWIRQRMQRACTDKGSIEKYSMRLPCHQYMANGRVQKVLPLLQDQLGREPTADELAAAAKIKVSQAQMALTTLSRSTVSLDAQWHADDSDAPIAELIADDQAVAPDREVIDVERNSAVWSIFSELDALERRVLTLRFGLGEDGRKHKQEEVCQMLDITKSRLTTIQRTALSKLRASEAMRDIALELLGTDD